MGLNRMPVSYRDEERRHKIFFVPPETILNLLLESALQPGTLVTKYLLKKEDFPDGIRVKHVHYDIARESYAFTLCHPSWPVVPDGEPLDTINRTGFEVVTLRVVDPTTAVKAEDAESWRDRPSFL